MPALVFTHHPRRLAARHSRIIETLLDMNRAGHGDAVTECIRMCRDLRASGHESRYAKPLRHLPGAWELKLTTRGGLRGGHGSTSCGWATGARCSPEPSTRSRGQRPTKTCSTNSWTLPKL